MVKNKNKLNKTNSSGWLDNYSEEFLFNENMKKKLKKYPAGGYLTFQEGYKGFGMGPDLYQDNSYFRSIMPDNIENMEAEINKPSIFSGINDVLGVANQAAGQITGLLSNFNFPKKSLTMDSLGGSQGIQLPGAEVLDNLNPTQTQSMMWQQSNPLFVAPQKNGGYLSKYQNGGMTDTMPLGGPEYIHPSNVFREHVIPVPKVHFTEDTSNFDMGVNLNDLIQMNGGKINKYYGGGFAGLYGNSYGSVYRQPRVFNSNANRATAAELQAATANDFLHTKMRKDRQSFEDDKVSWGAFDFLKEPVGGVLGVLSTVPIVGDITKNALGDSFLTRTGGYTVGKGIGNVGIGAAKIVGGLAGRPDMLISGIGDVGEGVGSTVGTFQAKDALSGYDKAGYISGNRMVNASQDFGNMMDTASGLFGNIKGGVGMLKNMGGLQGLGTQMRGGKTGMKGFGNFMGSLTGFGQDGGYIDYFQEGGIVEMLEDYEIPKFKKGGLTAKKAIEILHDKSVHGKPLTDKQRKYFGYIASQKKSNGGWLDSNNEWEIIE